MRESSALSTLERSLYIVAGAIAAIALSLNFIQPLEILSQSNYSFIIFCASLLALVAAIVGYYLSTRLIVVAAIWLLASSSLVALFLLQAVQHINANGEVTANGAFWCLVISAWLLAWACVSRFAEIESRSRIVTGLISVLIPVVFGAWLLLLWEFVTQGMDVPMVLLPAPSDIADRLSSSVPTLWADFKQTFIKSVLTGYAMGCAAGFVVAILIDRSPFLKAGLLPVGNLVAALPIVGIAPIMVMWFGFDWQSKAAVVVVMTFFPMLVNTVVGLTAATSSQLDLMSSYAASYWQSLFKLRLPQALPFIFNALKINSTLALIGAIVAEFFGTPIVGMGFRISTEVGKMNVDMVWAEIAVAALAGSLFYGLVALIERAVTFWHPSIRAA